MTAVVKDKERPDFDVLYVFVVLLATLFIWRFGPVAYLIILAPAAYTVVNYERMTSVMVRGFPLLLLPLFAIISTVWSLEPQASFYFGLQYLITVYAGVLVGLATRGDNALLGLFAALAVTKFASLVAGMISGDILWSLSTGWNYLGFTGSKNAFGDTGALAAMLALAALMAGWVRRSKLIMLAAFLSLVISVFFVVVLSHSVGAIVGMLIGFIVIAGFGVLRIVPEQFRLLMGGFFLVLLLLVLTTGQFWIESLLDMLIEYSGKDATLTGRTYIWERGDAEIARFPAFGVGFSAFWEIGNLEAEAIWRRMLIENRTGFNFHSTIYEIRVHLGLVGLVLYSVVAIISAAVLFVRTYINPNFSGAFFCAVCVYESARLSFETVAVSSFHYSTIIVFAAFAFAFRPRSHGEERHGVPVYGQLTGRLSHGRIARPA